MTELLLFCGFNRLMPTLCEKFYFFGLWHTKSSIMEDLPFCGQGYDFFQNNVDFSPSMICDKKKVNSFQIHFAHKSTSNRMVAVLLEANASFHKRFRKNVSLNFPKKISFMKTKITRPGEPEYQKENQSTNRKSYNTWDFDFDCFSWKKQPREKILNRQVLVPVMVFRKVNNLCFLVFFWETRLRLKENNNTLSL